MLATLIPVLTTSENHSDLRELTDRLINPYIDKAGHNKSFFVNEIPDHLQLCTDTQMFASVLSGLLSAIVSYTRDSCIRMTAKVYGSVVLLKLKDSNSSDIYGIEAEVQKFKPLAEKIRGSVHVTNQRKKLTTITFGFPNLSL
ncbi:MAG TPA: hypothetical protein VJ111_00380 [Chitinophagaceae bacterium]|nr:hypothetical protein [Chitinophagaceae bacterium]